MQFRARAADTAFPEMAVGTVLKARLAGTGPTGKPVGKELKERPVGTGLQENLAGMGLSERVAGMEVQERAVGMGPDDSFPWRVKRQPPLGTEDQERKNGLVVTWRGNCRLESCRYKAGRTDYAL